MGTQPCTQVKPGDVLGLYFNTATNRAIDAYFYGGDSPPLVSLNNLNQQMSTDPVVGTIVSTASFLQPYYLDASAFYINGKKC